MAQSADQSADIQALLEMVKHQMQQQQTLLQRLDEAQRPAMTTSSGKAVSCKDAPKLLATATLNEFARWKTRWDDYVLCQHLSEQRRETQVAALRTCFDDDLVRFLRQGVIEVDENADIEVHLNAIKGYVRSQQNPLLDRMRFFQRSQEIGEGFDDFLASVKEMKVACDFSVNQDCVSCKKRDEEALRDKLVVGIRNSEVRQKLLATTALSLDDTVKIARAEEAAKVTHDKLPGGSMAVTAVRAKSSYKKQQNFIKPGSKTCGKCGRLWHKDVAECPARNIECHECKKRGHFAKFCRNKTSPKAGRVSVSDVRATSENVRLIKVEISGDAIMGVTQFRDDTGADVDTIGPASLTALGGNLKSLTPVRMPIRAADSSKLRVLGKINAKLTVNSKSIPSELFVVEGVQEPLLSKRSLTGLGFLPENWPVQIANIARIADSDTASVETQLLEEFADVFDNSTLKTMSTTPVDIRLEEGAKPFCVYTARQIPFAFRDQVKQQLEDMESQSIIEKVTEPSEWCHPVVIVDKKGTDEKRLTVDLTKLNRQVERKVHNSSNAREVLSEVKNARIFTTIDAHKGYWQVPLTESAKKLTTFITPWGRYRFLRNPMGYVSAGDEYNERMDFVLQGISNVGKVVDDIVVYDNDMSAHIDRVRMILQKCRENQVTLSKSKFIFGRPEATYCGYILSQDGWRVDDAKVKAIKEFPVPRNKTDMRSFFGLFQQFSNFTTNLSKLAEPLRHMLKEKNEFLWDENIQKSFDSVKAELTKVPVLTFFEPSLPVRLETDASRVGGLGFALLQNVNDEWKLVQCGSRFISDTESRYAMIELELLAVAWAVNKCSIYLQGRQFELIVDHRPLVPILNSYSLDQIENERLLRLRLKLVDYCFTTRWRKGKEHFTADALSRHPVEQASPEDELAEKALVCNRVAASSLLVDKFEESCRQDEEYVLLRQTIENGFPKTKAEVPECLKPFWAFQNELCIDGDVVLKGARLVVPRVLRNEVMQKLHSSHQGIERTKQRARQIVFWPGMSHDVDNVVSTCTACCRYRPSQQKEPLVQVDIPAIPFSSTCADFFTAGGKEWLVYVDRTSGWTCVSLMGRSSTAESTIGALRSWFSDVGVPDTLTTDGGPQFSSIKFKEFCRRWDITHNMSTPYYPQSNGRAEAAVKSVKKLLLKVATERGFDMDAFHEGLLELRNTPGVGGLSPAQVLLGRPLKSFIFAHRKVFDAKWRSEIDAARSKREKIREKSKVHYDSTANPLRENIVQSTVVEVQNPHTKLWDKVGKVVVVGNRRNFLVQFSEGGRTSWRNRRFLRPHRTPVPRTSGTRSDPPSGPVLSTSPAPAEASTGRECIGQRRDDGQPSSSLRPTRSRRQAERLLITTHKGQSYT